MDFTTNHAENPWETQDSFMLQDHSDLGLAQPEEERFSQTMLWGMVDNPPLEVNRDDYHLSAPQPMQQDIPTPMSDHQPTPVVQALPAFTHDPETNYMLALAEKVRHQAIARRCARNRIPSSFVGSSDFGRFHR